MINSLAKKLKTVCALLRSECTTIFFALLNLSALIGTKSLDLWTIFEIFCRFTIWCSNRWNCDWQRWWLCGSRLFDLVLASMTQK